MNSQGGGGGQQSLRWGGSRRSRGLKMDQTQAMKRSGGRVFQATRAASATALSQGHD